MKNEIVWLSLIAAAFAAGMLAEAQTGWAWWLVRLVMDGPPAAC